MSSRSTRSGGGSRSHRSSSRHHPDPGTGGDSTTDRSGSSTPVFRDEERGEVSQTSSRYDQDDLDMNDNDDIVDDINNNNDGGDDDEYDDGGGGSTSYSRSGNRSEMAQDSATPYGSTAGDNRSTTPMSRYDDDDDEIDADYDETGDTEQQNSAAATTPSFVHQQNEIGPGETPQQSLYTPNISTNTTAQSGNSGRWGGRKQKRKSLVGVSNKDKLAADGAQSGSTTTANNGDANATSNSNATGGGGYGPRSGKKRRQPKVAPEYDCTDLSRPFPDDYQMGCFLNGQFFVVTILGHRRPETLSETTYAMLRDSQQLHENIIPTPYPPETLPYDYASHTWCYYVHFNRWDRRLDQWVSRDRLRCLVELIRFMKPHSLTHNPSGRHSSRTSGFYVKYDRAVALRQQFPGLTVLSPSQQAEQLRQFQSPTNASGNTTPSTPNRPNMGGALPTSNNMPSGLDSSSPLSLGTTNADGSISLLNGNNSNTLSLEDDALTPPSNPAALFLIPYIVPSPLPIIPVLPPDVYNSRKIMDQFETLYEDTALATLQLVLNHPLGQHILESASSTTPPPPPTVISSYSKPGKAAANTNAAAAAAASHAGDSITHHDGWVGPSYIVELPEVAMLHFGPDDEDEEHLIATRYKTVSKMVLGKYQLTPWYFSPYPEEYCKSGTLWLCEHCLSPFAYEEELLRHMDRCPIRHPPGQEIYRSKENNCEICMFEVDGAKEVIFCENLCYLAKSFLDHKTLWEDTSIFLFYVLCELTPRGAIIVGYYSKEKAWLKNNLACILTFPQHQGKSYGKFLISVSYELAKIEQRVGGPERPLSDLGRVSYIAYWTECSLKAINHILSTNHRKQHTSIDFSKPLQNYKDLATACPVLLTCSLGLIEKVSVSIDEISRLTYIHPHDIVDALRENNVLVYGPGQWCFNITTIRAILNRAIQRQRKKEEAFKRKSQIQRAAFQSIRYAIPSRIRWRPYTIIAKKRHGGEEEDEIGQPFPHAFSAARRTRSHHQ